MTQDIHEPMAEANQTDENQPQPLPKSTPYLLGLVIFLGVAIIACLAVLVITIIMRISADDSTAKDQKAAAEPLQVNEILVPAGATLMTVQPFERNILVRVQDGENAIIIVYDPREGVERSRIRLKQGN